ncbi:MAG: CAP domain-containing protein [Candidatus Staskawiczbacteria bacterium]|nr:CAP domain-containing protein [Candidatus Staskawiczbacteria bacterium]
MAIKKLVLFLFIVVAFGAGVYFKNDVLRFYNNFDKQVKNFQKTDIGSVITQAGKQLLTPPPLNIGGFMKPVVLLQSKIITETNLQRQGNGNLPALAENIKLDEAAAAKANDILLKQYFEHVSPTGIDPGKLVQNYGYEYILAGENLILGNFSSEKEVLQYWMNSPGHRANILNNRYTEMGAAIVKGNYKGDTVWIGVQEFGLPLSTCAQPSVELKNQIDFDKTKLDSLLSQINQEKNQIDGADQRSSIYNQMIDDYNQIIAQYNSLAETLKGVIATYNNQVNIFNGCVNGK